MEIYIFANGQQKGPYSGEELKTLLALGALTITDLYWHEGCDNWLPISKLPTVSHEKGSIPPIPHPTNKEESPKERRTTPSNAFGFFLVLIPIISALTLWLCAKRVFMIDFPDALNVILMGTVFLTAILISVEATHLHMGHPIAGQPTTGPVGWFFCVLGIWIIAYPAYFLSRRRYGGRNFTPEGILSALMFLGVAVNVDTFIANGSSGVLGKIVTFFSGTSIGSSVPEDAIEEAVNNKHPAKETTRKLGIFTPVQRSHVRHSVTNHYPRTIENEQWQIYDIKSEWTERWNVNLEGWGEEKQCMAEEEFRFVRRGNRWYVTFGN